MKLYLAAMYVQMPQMKIERQKFIDAGHIITARWINGDEESMSQTEGACMDLDDINEADGIVNYTLPKGTMFSSGGRHVEFGYAIANHKRLYTIGERENIFHHLRSVHVFDSTEALIYYLREFGL